MSATTKNPNDLDNAYAAVHDIYDEAINDPNRPASIWEIMYNCIADSLAIAKAYHDVDEIPHLERNLRDFLGRHPNKDTTIESYKAEEWIA